jgi:hypothetical protein
MTRTITVEVDEEKLAAAAGLLGTTTDEDTLVRAIHRLADRAANMAEIRAHIAEIDAEYAASKDR